MIRLNNHNDSSNNNNDSSNNNNNNNDDDDMATNNNTCSNDNRRRSPTSRSILKGRDNIRQQQQQPSPANHHGIGTPRLRRSYSSPLSSARSNSSLLYKIEEQKQKSKSSSGHRTMPSSSLSSIHLPSLLPASDHSYCGGGGATTSSTDGYVSNTTCTTRASTNCSCSNNMSLDSSLGSFLGFEIKEGQDNDNDNDTLDSSSSSSSRSRCSSTSSLGEDELNISLLMIDTTESSNDTNWNSQQQQKQQQQQQPNMNSSRRRPINNKSSRRYSDPVLPQKPINDKSSRRYSDPVLPQKQQYPNISDNNKYNKHQDHHQWYNNMYHTNRPSSSSDDATNTAICSSSSSSLSKISPKETRRLSTTACALSTPSIFVGGDTSRKIVCPKRPLLPILPPTFSSSSFSTTTTASSPIKIQTKRTTNTKSMYDYYDFFFPNITFTLQLIVLFVIVGLVFYSRSQAVFTTDTILKLRGEESIGLLKLHQIENHSLHIHELITQRLLRRQSSQQPKVATTSDDYDNDTNTNTNNLEQQYKQLIDMSSELRNHATVTTLQETIKDTAIEEIVNTYGEGPVKVVLELDFNTNTNTDHDNENENDNNMAVTAATATAASTATRIAIVLWPDTPHAAWTWLEQIQKKIWDGANLEWDTSSTMLQFKPELKQPKITTTTNTATKGGTRSSAKKVNNDDDDNDDAGGHIEFIEQHPMSRDDSNDKHHGAWTVGLRETSSSSNLEMFINLSDNQSLYQHEATCVGKIIDGFDTLQRLVETTLIVSSSTSTSTQDTTTKTNVSVKSIAASHMTNQELEQIYR